MNPWLKTQIVEVRVSGQSNRKLIVLPAEFIIIDSIDAIYQHEPIKIFHCEKLDNLLDQGRRLIWQAQDFVCYNGEEYQLLYIPILTKNVFAFAVKKK